MQVENDFRLAIPPWENWLSSLRLNGRIDEREYENWSILSYDEFLETVIQTISDEGTVQLSESTRRTRRSELWRTIAIELVKNEKFEDAYRIWEAMLETGSDNPAVLSDYGVFLLKKDIRKGTKLIAQAYDKDCERPRRETILLPAFKNLVLALRCQAQAFYEEGDRINSLILVWQSIEYSLMTMWMQFLNSQELSANMKNDLIRWNTDKIIWVLKFNNILDDQTRESVSLAKRRRNDVLHARNKIPPLQEIEQFIQTAARLHDQMVSPK